MHEKPLTRDIIGQDRSFLADLLLSERFVVNGMGRRASTIHTDSVDLIFYVAPFFCRARYEAATRQRMTALGWTAKLPLRQGLEATFQWYRENVASTLK